MNLAAKYGHRDSDDSNIPGLIAKFVPFLWLNRPCRTRAILLTSAIAIMTLNGLQVQFFGVPFRLQSYYINSYRDRNVGGSAKMTVEQQRSLRNRNLSGCEKSPYISPDQAESFLASSENNNVRGDRDDTDDLEPTHITLCKALIARNAEAEGQDYESEEEKETEGGGNPFFGFGFRVKTNGFLNVNESREICTDRERPHSAFMQMISSSIVAYVGSRFGLIYKHNCASTISSNKNLDFDVTTIQQIFSQITMQLNENKISLGEVVFDLCQSCIDQEYDPEYIRQRQEMKQNKIEDTHHCFLFPNRGDVHIGLIQKQEDEGPIEKILDDEGQIVNTALDAVLPLIRNRLYHASLDWAPRAHIPSHEPLLGIVIYLDSQSLPIPFSLYKSHVQDGTNRVSILSSPRCANSKLGDVGCLMYGLELKQYLQNGFRGIEVSFDLISSTAAAYSRMILSHILICPPGTITCLFPVLARQATKSSVIFESQDRLSTFHWFNYVIQSIPNNIRIVPVDESDMMQVDDEQKFVQRQFKSMKEVMKVEAHTSPATNLPLGNDSDIHMVSKSRVFKSVNSIDDFDPLRGKIDAGNTDRSQVLIREKVVPDEFTLSIPLLRDHEKEHLKKIDKAGEVIFPEYTVGSSLTQSIHREESDGKKVIADTLSRAGGTEELYPPQDYSSTAKLFGG